MLGELLNRNGCTFADVPVRICGQIEACEQRITDKSIITNAECVLRRFCSQTGFLRKSELREIWISDDVSITIKFLITLWWGHPRFQIINTVYSDANILSLYDNSSRIQNDLEALSKEVDENKFRTSLRLLYQSFERGGKYHLDGVGEAFFTKFFHFWFVSHPLASANTFLPVIADRRMKMAIFAEMMDDDNLARNEIFSINDQYPISIGFVSIRGTSAGSYLRFLDYFNDKVASLKQIYPELTPFLLEDIIFNNAYRLSELYVACNNNTLFLPPWIAGRYNEAEQIAIVFNNLIGQSFLFEGVSAKLVGKILEYDYYDPINIRELVLDFGCTLGDIIQFFIELSDNQVIVSGHPTEKDILKIRRTVVWEKKKFLKQSKGTENLQSVFELVDIDYRDRIERQGIPSSVSFELTYGCNEMCLHCYNPGSSREECIAKKVASDEMKLEDYKSVLDQLAAMGVPKVLFTGGDPFIKKDFIEILRYAHKKKFAVSIYTNGLAMYNHQRYYEDVLNCYPHTIGLSLYSIEPAVHEKITRVPGSGKKTIAIAEKFSKAGVGMLLKCPIMRINKDSYRAVYDYAISINAVPEFEVNITSSVEGDNYAVDNLRLTEEEMLVLLKDPIIPLSTERRNISRYMERSPDMGFCGAAIDVMNIKPNGEVSPCIAFTAPCGNVKSQRIEEIWKNSETLKRVRKLTYGDSDRCGCESYCKYCNRCIGQSYTEHGVPENYSTDNCFIAKIREKLSKNK